VVEEVEHLSQPKVMEELSRKEAEKVPGLLAETQVVTTKVLVKAWEGLLVVVHHWVALEVDSESLKEMPGEMLLVEVVALVLAKLYQKEEIHKRMPAVTVMDMDKVLEKQLEQAMVQALEEVKTTIMEVEESCFMDSETLVVLEIWEVWVVLEEAEVVEAEVAEARQVVEVMEVAQAKAQAQVTEEVMEAVMEEVKVVPT